MSLAYLPLDSLPAAASNTARSAPTARVALFERSLLFRECLADWLLASHLELVLSDGDLEHFATEVTRGPIDVAFVDFSIPPLADNGQPVQAFWGVELDRLHQAAPQLRIVVLGMNLDAALIELCRQHGAMGVLDTRAIRPRTLVDAADALIEGQPFVTHETLARSHNTDDVMGVSLSRRERQVLGLIAEGADNLKIAAHLDICERTVKGHVSGLYRKLEVETRVQLALVARRWGVRAEHG